MSGDQCPFLSLSRVNIVRIEVGKFSLKSFVFQVRLDSCPERYIFQNYSTYNRRKLIRNICTFIWNS